MFHLSSYVAETFTKETKKYNPILCFRITITILQFTHLLIVYRTSIQKKQKNVCNSFIYSMLQESDT